MNLFCSLAALFCFIITIFVEFGLGHLTRDSFLEFFLLAEQPTLMKLNYYWKGTELSKIIRQAYIGLQDYLFQLVVESYSNPENRGLHLSKK